MATLFVHLKGGEADGETLTIETALVNKLGGALPPLHVMIDEKNIYELNDQVPLAPDSYIYVLRPRLAKSNYDQLDTGVKP
jgi:hypothetical protein